MRINSIKIYERMEHRHHNTSTLAKKVDITWPNLKRLLSGQTSRINFALLGRICSELDLLPSDVLTSEDQVDQERAEARRRNPDWPRSSERKPAGVLCDSGGDDDR